MDGRRTDPVSRFELERPDPRPQFVSPSIPPDPSHRQAHEAQPPPTAGFAQPIPVARFAAQNPQSASATRSAQPLPAGVSTPAGTNPTGSDPGLEAADHELGTGGIEMIQERLDDLSHKLRALETRVWDTREAGERTKERFIDALETLDSRFNVQQRATVERIEQLIFGLSATLDELRIQMKAEGEIAEVAVFKGFAKLDARVNLVEQSGRDIQDRIARAVATLSVATDEWRAVAPVLAEGPTQEVIESILNLDAAVGKTQEELAARLERSMVALADSVQAWKDEIVYTAGRSEEKIWVALSALEAKLKAGNEEQVASGLSLISDHLTARMKTLEKQIHERQAAMITLIVGGGAGGGLDLSDLNDESITRSRPGT
ncbi:MAG: hypothetical protein ACT4OM_08725 [Actinomycetota bacterium]